MGGYLHDPVKEAEQNPRSHRWTPRTGIDTAEVRARILFGHLGWLPPPTQEHNPTMPTAPDHFAVIRAAGQAQLKLLAEHVIDTISRSDALIDDVIDTLPDTLEDADLANVGMIDEEARTPST